MKHIPAGVPVEMCENIAGIVAAVEARNPISMCRKCGTNGDHYCPVDVATE